MLQEWADRLRERMAFHHQRVAKHHADRRDHWRWQVERPWVDLVPVWLPWVGLGVFWVIVWWLA